MGGVIYDPRGNLAQSYEWNLGMMTNNQAKAYELLTGLKLAIAFLIKELTFLGDSHLIIQYMRGVGTLPSDFQLATILKWARCFSKKITKLDWLHVLHELNIEADKRANMVMEKKGGTISFQLFV
jgi:ribonuclease HI